MKAKDRPVRISKEALLMREIAKESGYSLAVVEDLLFTIGVCSARLLKEGKEVKIKDFISLQARTVKARMVRHPATGVQSMSKAKIAIKVKPSGFLNYLLNEKDTSNEQSS